MANNGSKNGKRQDIKEQPSRFERWAKKTFAFRTSDRRQTVMPGIVWGSIAALVIIGVAIGSGWSPFGPKSQDSVELPLETPVEMTPDISLQTQLDTPAESDLVASVEPLLELADASRGDAQQEEPQEETPTSSVSTNLLNPSTTAREAALNQVATPPQSAPTPTATRPARDPALPAVSLAQMAWPVQGDIVRPFGWYRYPALSEWRYSNAVVFQPAAGATDVRAALAGRVHDVVNEAGLWRLRIEHAGGWFTEYEGLTDVAVESYQIVETAQIIGQTDEHAPTGVRFTVLQGNEPIDPTEYLGPYALLVTTR